MSMIVRIFSTSYTPFCFKMATSVMTRQDLGENPNLKGRLCSTASTIAMALLVDPTIRWENDKPVGSLAVLALCFLHAFSRSSADRSKSWAVGRLTPLGILISKRSILAYGSVPLGGSYAPSSTASAAGVSARSPKSAYRGGREKEETCARFILVSFSRTPAVPISSCVLHSTLAVTAPVTGSISE